MKAYVIFVCISVNIHTEKCFEYKFGGLAMSMLYTLYKVVALIFRAEEWAEQETNVIYGGYMFLRNVGLLSTDYSASYRWR
jgi:hypothetical protein